MDYLYVFIFVTAIVKMYLCKIIISICVAFRDILAMCYHICIAQFEWKVSMLSPSSFKQYSVNMGNKHFVN